MFHSVTLLSQAPLARGSCALPSILFIIDLDLHTDDNGSWVTACPQRTSLRTPYHFLFLVSGFVSCFTNSPGSQDDQETYIPYSELSQQMIQVPLTAIWFPPHTEFFLPVPLLFHSLLHEKLSDFLTKIPRLDDVSVSTSKQQQLTTITEASYLLNLPKQNDHTNIDINMAGKIRQKKIANMEKKYKKQ